MSEYEGIYISQVLQRPEILNETIILPGMLENWKYKQVFTTVKKMQAKSPADLMAISKESGIAIHEIAGMEAIAGSPANWRYYENKIVDLWKRKVLKLSLIDKIKDMEHKNANEVIAEIDELLTSLSVSTGNREIINVGDKIMDYLGAVEERRKNEGMLGLRTGITGFDDATCGLRPTLLYVIGARPSQGKSALALNMVSNIAKQGIPVGYLSIESSITELIDRLFAIRGRIDARKIQIGMFSGADFHRVMETGAMFKNEKILVWDKPNAYLEDCISTARNMVRGYGVKVLFVDYAQIIRVRGAQEKRAAVEEVSQSMKELARELNVPVVLLAQLKRDADNRRPELSDFQWSSQFEQDADVAALIHHKYDKEKRYKIERSYLLLEKVRDGKRCIVNIVFQPEFLRMIDDEEHGVTDDL